MPSNDQIQLLHFIEKKDCYSHKKTYTNVIAALFIIAKNWKCA